MVSILLASAIVIVASTAQSLTGFGFALVLTPLLSQVYDVRTVAAVNLSLSTLINLWLMRGMREHVNVRHLSILLIGSVVAVPLGATVLLYLNEHVLKLIIGLVALMFSVPLARGLVLQTARPSSPEIIAIGAVTGLLMGATGMGGPIVAMHLVARGEKMEVVRATNVTFFALAGFFGLAILFAFAGFFGMSSPSAGSLDWRIAGLDLVLLPAMLIGVRLGMRLFPHLRETMYRPLICALIAASGLLSAYSGLHGLLSV